MYIVSPPLLARLALPALLALLLPLLALPALLAVEYSSHAVCCCRERLNNGQGLGFTIFSKVVDKKTLNMIVFSVGSFYGTVIPLIMAFMPDPVSTSGESIQCLGAEEYAALGRVWLEGGCVALNDTIGTVLGGG